MYYFNIYYNCIANIFHTGTRPVIEQKFTLEVRKVERKILMKRNMFIKKYSPQHENILECFKCINFTEQDVKISKKSAKPFLQVPCSNCKITVTSKLNLLN